VDVHCERRLTRRRWASWTPSTVVVLVCTRSVWRWSLWRGSTRACSAPRAVDCRRSRTLAMSDWPLAVRLRPLPEKTRRSASSSARPRCGTPSVVSGAPCRPNSGKQTKG